MKPAASHPPIVWSIAGLDTAGGAGLSADQRACDAMGVHLCPVAACLTAQHSQGVEAIFPVPQAQLRAQLAALATDLPPRAIKTGLLGSVKAIAEVAHWVDHFRAQAPTGQDPHQHLALVVDPVLKASAGGASFSHEAIVQAYREQLMPRATVLTPNRAEAAWLLGLQTGSLPDMAKALLAHGVRAALITGGDAQALNAPSGSGSGSGSGSSSGPLAQVQALDTTHSTDWLQTPHASGWLSAPRVNTPHHHGTGCTLASGIAAALALGHAEADACVLGKMLTHHALMHSHAAGQGAGPAMARASFGLGTTAQGGAPLPLLGLGEQLPWALQDITKDHTSFRAFTPPRDGLYGILATGKQVAWAVDAGLRCVQLRHKASEGASGEFSIALAAAKRTGAQLFVNDHWALALPHTADDDMPALGIHLGQEDLLALTAADQEQLRAAAPRLMLGLSSHSLWELARAAGCGPSYIACGPVQATTTKDMPWLPQGTHNLRWWVANSPVPVVGIGGLLTPEDLVRFAGCGAAALCVVRGLGEGPAEMLRTVPALREGLRGGVRDGVREGLQSFALRALRWPHPTLPRKMSR